jgi:hypothetical protein
MKSISAPANRGQGDGHGQSESVLHTEESSETVKDGGSAAIPVFAQGRRDQLSRYREFLWLTTIRLCAKGSPVWLAFRQIWSWQARHTDGRDAIQQFRSHHPDVTLIDLQMPEMNGIDALIAIRN